MIQRITVQTCAYCGKPKRYPDSFRRPLASGQIIDRKSCNDCIERIRVNKSIIDGDEFYKEYAEMARRVLQGVKTRTKSKELPPVEIDIFWILDKYKAGVCEMTGIELDLNGAQYQPNGPAIDKIIPDKGYTLANSRMVCNWYNLAKWSWSDDIVLEYASRLIVNIGVR